MSTFLVIVSQWVQTFQKAKVFVLCTRRSEEMKGRLTKFFIPFWVRISQIDNVTKIWKRFCFGNIFDEKIHLNVFF